MKISIRLDTDLYEQVRRFAQENDLTMSQIVRFALRKYLERQEAKDKE